MAKLKLYLLGPPWLELEDSPKKDPEKGPVKIQRRKVLAMLAYLAVSGEAQRRDTLATLLWPDVGQSEARAALTRHLSEGRKVIGEDHVLADRETVALAGEVWCDVDRFWQLTESSSNSSDSLDSLTEAVSLYRDDFLTGFTLPNCPDYDEWQFFQTEGLRQQMALNLQSLLQIYVDKSNYEYAIPHARRWLSLDPLHEPAHLQLIQLYAWHGQWAAALRQYETCLRLLEEELGVPPSAETEQLYQAVRANRLSSPVHRAEPGEAELIRAKSKEMAESQQLPPISSEETDETQPFTSPELVEGESGFDKLSLHGELNGYDEAILDQPTDRPPVVARESELTRLDGFLTQAIAGKGSVVFVTGEAGVGKTSLVSEFILHAQQRHAHLLSVVGNCNAQTGRGDPYLPFREILLLLIGDVEDKLAQGAISTVNAQRLWGFFNTSREVLVEFGPMLINTLVSGARLASRVERFATESATEDLTDIVGWLERVERLTTTEARDKLDLSQAYIFEQYAAVLQTLAAKQPLVLWLDDLHWVDPASADLLFHLCRRLVRSRILVIGTYRPEEIAVGRGNERHPLANVVSEFKRSWGDIQVDLDQAQLNDGKRFVESLLDAEPNRFEENFRQTLYNHTGGHPLFTVELLRDLRDRSVVVQDDSGHWLATQTLDWGALPARVEGIIEKRIGRLDAELQEALTIASIEGEQFTAEVVAQVHGMTPSKLVRQLSREADKEHRLIQAQGSQHLEGRRLSRYQFRHNLIQMYLYNRLDEVERAYLHDAVGHALEELYGGQATALEAHPEALAYHFYAAGLWSKALAYAQQAGEKALALQAPQDAITQFTQALDAAARLYSAPFQNPSLVSPVEAMENSGFESDRDLSQQPSAALYRLRGQAFDTLGHFDQARADYEAAQEAATELGDQYLIWQTLLDLGQLWAARDYEESKGYCQQALELAYAMDDQAAIGQSLNRLGNWLMNTGQPSEAFGCHREALEHFEALDDRLGVAATLDRLAAASFFCGNGASSVAYYKQAIPILRDIYRGRFESRRFPQRIQEKANVGFQTELSIDNQQTLISCLANLATMTLNERLAREAIRVAQEIEWRAGEAFASHNLSAVLSFRGDYGQGLAAAKNGLEVAQAIGQRVWQAACEIDLGVIYFALLAFDEARRHLERGLETAEDVGSTVMITYASGFLATLYIQQRHFDAAARLLPDLPVKPVMGRDHWLVKPATELTLIQQGAARAHHLLDQQTLPERSNWLGWLAYFYGAIPLLRGELLTELGWSGEAETELHSLLELYQEQGVRMDLWRIHLALGRVYQATGDLDEAERALATAKTIVDELAMTVTDNVLRDNFRRHALDLISVQ
ncbi:MAG: AAA family ATPase [Chloroflexota bacterium]